MLLEIQHLSFSYLPGQKLFCDLNLTVEKGKTVALAGESGCGKSTLLSLMYGLLDWEEGEIFFDGKPVYGPRKNIVPGESGMKFVAQHYDLMPYATVADNVGKFISNINLKEKKDRVNELLEVVGLTAYAHVLPKFLSGGQQQRVAIARALSVLPKLLLLDEPFSNLDFPRKIKLRERLFNYVKQHGISMIISTHEIQEIMPWLDQIVVLKGGQIVQAGSPEVMYKNPSNEYVAGLFGEINTFTEAEAAALGLHKTLYYPYEIVMSDEGIAATVLESRFAGNYYWTKIVVNAKEILMYTAVRIEGAVTVSFSKE